MAARGLTVLAIRNAKGSAKKYVLHDGRGLDVEVQPTGKKTLYVRYRRPGSGKPANLRLGLWLDDDVAPRPAERETPPEPKIGDALTLERARRLASTIRELIKAGVDPGAQQQAAKHALAEIGDRDDFEVVARRFLERHARPNTRPSSFRETAQILGFRVGDDGALAIRTADPAKDRRPEDTWPAVRWKGRKIQEISRRDVNELLDAIADAGVSYASNATLSAVRKLFNWSVEQDVLAVSPCTGVRKRATPVERDRVLADQELRLVWLGAEQLGWPFGHLVRLLALTACRRDEWAEATWAEVDLKRRIFSLPPERSKNGIGLELPLSPQAIKVLEGLKEHQLAGEPDYLFSTGRGRAAAKPDAPLRPISGFSKAKEVLDKEMVAIARREAEEAGQDPATVKAIPAWRLHDLRRTAVTGMARLGVALPVIERAVNHVSGSFAGVVGVYQRHGFGPEVRDALERWGAGVDRVVAGGTLEPPEDDDKVVKLEARRG